MEEHAVHAESAPVVTVEDAAAIEHRIALQRIVDLERTLERRDRLIADQQSKLQMSKQKIVDLGAAVQSLKSRIVSPLVGEASGVRSGARVASQGAASVSTRVGLAAASSPPRALVQMCDASCSTDNTEWVLTQLAAKLSSEHEASIVALKQRVDNCEQTIRTLGRERDDAQQLASELRDAQRRRHQWLFDCLKHTPAAMDVGDDNLAIDSCLASESSDGRPQPLDSVSADSIMDLSLPQLATLVGRVIGTNPEHVARLAMQIHQLRQQWNGARTSSPSAARPSGGSPRRISPLQSPPPRLTSPPTNPSSDTKAQALDGVGRSLLEDLALETSMPMTTSRTDGGAVGVLGLQAPLMRPQDGNNADNDTDTLGIDQVSLRSLEMRLEVLRRAEAQSLPDTLRRGIAAEITEIELRLASHASSAASALRSAALSYQRSVVRHAALRGGDTGARRVPIQASAEAFRMRSPSEEGDGG